MGNISKSAAERTKTMLLRQLHSHLADFTIKNILVKAARGGTILWVTIKDECSDLNRALLQ